MYNTDKLHYKISVYILQQIMTVCVSNDLAQLGVGARVALMGDVCGAVILGFVCSCDRRL